MNRYYGNSYQEESFNRYQPRPMTNESYAIPQKIERYQNDYRRETYNPFQQHSYNSFSHSPQFNHFNNSFQSQQNSLNVNHFYRSYQMDEQNHPSQLNQMNQNNQMNLNNMNNMNNTNNINNMNNQMNLNNQNNQTSQLSQHQSFDQNTNNKQKYSPIKTAFNTSHVNHTTIVSNDFNNFNSNNSIHSNNFNNSNNFNQSNERNEMKEMKETQNNQLNQNNTNHIKNPFAPTPKVTQKKRPIYALTLDIHITYKADQSLYSQKPKKYLTKITETCTNKGKDNANYELLVAVDDVIGSAFIDEGSDCYLLPNSQYTILSLLGSGTFGQVFKCRDNSTNTLVAVKILKSKQVFFRQGMLEIAVLTTLKDVVDVNDKYHTVKIFDYFLYHGHVCIVFELLSVNLYDMLRSNKNVGMGLTFNRHVLRQLLESLHGLTTMNIIHCDVKTENILLIQNTSDIKLIDFGSACFEKSTLYNYIQSRHYRAPEIILGIPYNCAIDMWSFGCVAAELFLGIPLFPGENEYNQLIKIIDMLGPIPNHILAKGTKTEKYYNVIRSGKDVKFELKTPQQYEKENNVKLQENKKYFRYKTLEEICQHVPLHRNAFIRDNDQVWRSLMYDFLRKILEYDASKRLTPSEALTHAFIKSKSNKQELLSLPLPLIPQEVTMDEIVKKVYGFQYNYNYIQTRDRYFSVPHNYFSAYIKCLKHGYVMNILHQNPFHYKPLKIINSHQNSSIFNFNEEQLISWGSNSDSENSSRPHSATLQSPILSQSPRLPTRGPPSIDPRRMIPLMRENGYYPRFDRYTDY